MRDLTLESSSILSWAFVLALYGFYSCLFIVCMHALYTCKRRNRFLLCSLIALYIFVSAHVGLYSKATYDAFVTYRINPGTEQYLWHYHANPLVGADYFFYWASNCITETLLMWRVYVVWKGTPLWYIAPTLALYLMSLGSSTFITVEQIQQSIQRVERTDTRNWLIMTVIGGLMVLENIVTTCMIAGRLWYMGRKVTTKRFPYARVIQAVVESATLYTIALLATTILGAVKLNFASNVGLRVCSIIVGICPTLFIWTINMKSPLDEDAVHPFTAKGNISDATNVEIGNDAYFKFATYAREKSEDDLERAVSPGTPSLAST